MDHLNSEESVLNGGENDAIMNFITCRTIRKKELYFCKICNNFLETLTLAKDHVRAGHIQKKSESSSSSPSLAVQLKPHDHEEQTRIEVETEYFECDDCHEFFETHDQLQFHRNRLRVHLPARRRVVKQNNVGKGSSDGQYSRKFEKIMSCHLPPPPGCQLPPTNNAKRPLFLKTVEARSILKGPRKIQDKTTVVEQKGSSQVAKKIGSTKSIPSISNKNKNDDDSSKNSTETSFMCAICQKRYTRNDNLKRHLIITHRRRRQGEEIIAKKSVEALETQQHNQSKLGSSKMYKKLTKFVQNWPSIKMTIKGG